MWDAGWEAWPTHLNSHPHPFLRQRQTVTELLPSPRGMLGCQTAYPTQPHSSEKLPERVCPSVA